MPTLDIPATVAGIGVFTTLVGGTTCTTTNDGDTSYLQQHVALSAGNNSGFNDHIQFPATSIPGTVVSTSLVTVTKGNDNGHAALFLTDESASSHFWPGIFADGATDWTEVVTPLTDGGSEVVTQSMIESGAVIDSGTTALLNGTWAGPVDLTLKWTYIALRVEYVSPCYETLTGEWVLGNGKDCTLTGDASTALNDGSDSTFVTFGDVAASFVKLNPFTRSTGLDVTIGVRASSTAGNSFFVDLWNDFGPDTATNFLISAPITVSSGGGIADYQHTINDTDLSDWDTDLATIVEGLRASDAVIWINGVQDVVIYEAWVRVGHKCVVNIPQLRKYPNPNIGPTRQWPRPRRGITGIR